MTKQCSKCKEIKKSTDFYRSTYSKDGLYSSCKECKIKINRTVTDKWMVETLKIIRWVKRNKSIYRQYKNDTTVQS